MELQRSAVSTLSRALHRISEECELDMLSPIRPSLLVRLCRHFAPIADCDANIVVGLQTDIGSFDLNLSAF